MYRDLPKTVAQSLRPKGANNKARGNAPGHEGPRDRLALKGRHNAADGHTT